ncbi:MAG: U32 family peptidase [Bacteroidia bacterium]|nr:U32 family peptidase [Bacteroidia bacterium]
MSKEPIYNRSEFEIMAPAGSWESLAAAFQAGADSVYFGIESLNMRARSSNNFTIVDLKEIARLCREKGVKSYLTINTVLYDGDLALMQQIVDAAKEAQISAIIAADVSVMSYARQKEVEIHLSTQLNIANIEALKFYAHFADVVVLARELNLDQVAEIYDQIVAQDIRGPHGGLIRIEMFCHGALCMAVSDVEMDIDSSYIMSPKDLKTIHFMNKMMDSGVRVFKIEGRARGPEYVKTVVNCYREAIESQVIGTFDSIKIEEWNSRLSNVFNRGFWDGYYLGQRLGEWTHQYGSSATKRKILIGKGIKYYSNVGVAEFLLESNCLEVGDEILVTGPTTGAVEAVVEEMRVEMQTVQKAVKGQHLSIPMTQKIRPSDKLYKVVHSDIL